MDALQAARDSASPPSVEEMDTPPPRSHLSIDVYKRQGMVRGMQNGILSVNVLAGRKIEYEAVNYAMKRPKKHFAAFEMPVIVDLDLSLIHI